MDSGFSKAEGRIAEEQFRRSLSEKELTILKMGEKGSSVQTIADKLNITQEEVQTLCKCKLFFIYTDSDIFS